MKRGSTLPSVWDGIEDEEARIVDEAGLTDRQKMFVHAYMRHRNGAQAAREAGYPMLNSRTAASSLKARPKVRDCLSQLLAARMRRLQATPQVIEQELMRIATASVGRFTTVQADGSMFLDFSRANEDDLAGLSSFKCEVEHRDGNDIEGPKAVTKMEAKLGNKLGALTILAQIHGMVGSDGANALVDIADAIREGRKRAGLEAKE